MSLLPQTKYGNCSKCGMKDTNVVKIGKELFCLQCNREIKTKNQVTKANVRNQVRGLGRKQVQEGNYFEAERQALINDLDFVFSRIVRMREADTNGYVECYTCNRKSHWTMMQCGHFIKRANTQVRWDFRNARPQCSICNEGKHGNLETYTQKLELEQKGLPDQLTEIAREPYKWSREELKTLLIDLRARLRIYEQRTKPLTNG